MMKKKEQNHVTSCHIYFYCKGNISQKYHFNSGTELKRKGQHTSEKKTSSQDFGKNLDTSQSNITLQKDTDELYMCSDLFKQPLTWVTKINIDLRVLETLNIYNCI